MNEQPGPVLYEILRNRLVSVTEEMRIALQSVSGSPTVTEATDFFTGLYVPDGSFATMGFQVAHEAPVVGGLIRHLTSSGRTPIRAGDMFIGNDPYVAALHQNDVQMACPIFVGDEVVAWAGVMAHETDLGGMNFASWCPGATEVFQEGLRIPAVKLVDRGEVREDVVDFILAASRLPTALGLDLRAFIATLNVATARITDLVSRYGAPMISATLHRMIDESEAALRERLRQLPDAVVHVRDFLEHDGHSNALYTVDLALTKRGDAITMDFSGSSLQAPGFINATRPGLQGGITGALLPAVGFGIAWNEGLLRPITVVAPDGLICTAQYPAPVGSATVETIWTVTNVVHRALSLLLACSPPHAHRAQGVSSGTMATFNMGGTNQYGERFGLHLLDPLAGGSGAYAGRDGVNAGGPPAVPMPAIADVESNEQASPLLYLYRRLRADSGGAGAARGGLSAEVALTVHGIEGAEALVMTHGAEVPNSTGIFGGRPGSTVRQRIGVQAVAGTRLPAEGPPDDVTDLPGEWRELGPKPGSLPMRAGDVFAVRWQGGGGYGDPLSRDPDAVAADVSDRLVSRSAATAVYGVAFDGDGRVDDRATRALRRRVRAGRLGAEPTAEPRPDATGHPIGPGLRLLAEDGEWVVRSSAGAELARGGTAWRAGATSRRVDPSELGIDLHEQLIMTEWLCPLSGESLAVDVHRVGAAPLEELMLEELMPEELMPEDMLLDL